MTCILSEGKLNLLLDGQFGSTGKGLFAHYISVNNHIDIAISNAGSNAGHTFYDFDNRKIIVKHLPVSGIVNKRCQIYLCAGAIIDPVLLLQEIEENDIDPCRIAIHPNAAIITHTDIECEKGDSSVKKIASTMSGVGSALVRKINREALLAKDIPELKEFISELDIHYYLEQGCTAFMEVPQGMDLSINHGYSYPYCTSRDITPASALNDAGVHPKFLGTVSVTLRTFPIRVGNVLENGKEVGYSGPFYNDSVETTWRKLRIAREYTTRTKRIRRVATFSNTQYRKMLSVMQPDYVFLNFCNYLGRHKLEELLKNIPKVTHLGFGPTFYDIRSIH